jgi:hypothetical protein
MKNPLQKLFSLRIGVNIKSEPKEILKEISSKLGIEPMEIPSVFKYSSRFSSELSKDKILTHEKSSYPSVSKSENTPVPPVNPPK